MGLKEIKNAKKKNPQKVTVKRGTKEEEGRITVVWGGLWFLRRNEHNLTALQQKERILG